jgi:hypothetical protein
MKNCEDCYYFKDFVEIGSECLHCVLSPKNASGVLNFKPIEEEKEIMKYNDYSVNVKFECKINKKITLDTNSSEKAALEIMKGLSDPDILDKVVKHIKEKMLCDKDATVSIYPRQVEAETIKKKPLILLCGKSGSGKTTVADLLQSKYGLKQLESYTTRPQRKADERGHGQPRRGRGGSENGPRRPERRPEGSGHHACRAGAARKAGGRGRHEPA